MPAAPGTEPKKIVKKKVVKKVVKKKKEDPKAEETKPAETKNKTEKKEKDIPKENSPKEEPVAPPPTEPAAAVEPATPREEVIAEKPKDVETTEAPVVEEKKIEIKKGYVPDEKELEKDVDFRNRLKKVEKYRKEEESGEWDVWSLLKSASSREYEAIAFKFGIVDMRAMLRRLSNTKKRETQKATSFSKKLPETIACTIGEKVVLEAEVANEQMTVKWQKNGENIEASKHFQIMTKENKRTLIIDQTVLSDDSAYSCVVGKDVTTCELFVREHPVTITKGLEDIQVKEGEDAEFNCELSNENGKFRILKDGSQIEQGEKYNIKKEGVKVTFNVKKISTDDEGFYQIVTNGAQSCAEIVVQETSQITQSFSDLKVNFKDTAEFACQVSDEAVKGQWLKDGKPIVADDRIKIIEDKKSRILTISKVNDNDQGEYSFATEGSVTSSITAALELTGGHIVVEKKKVPPKIFLDNSQKDRAIIVRAGNKIKLDIPISGEPAPVPEWKKGPKDGPTETIPSTGKRIWSNTSAEHQITYMEILGAKISDSGLYTCVLTWDKSDQEGTDSEYIRRQEFEFLLKIVDVPATPTTPVISNVTAETCQVEWKEPGENAGCPIKGYVIERKKTQSERWIRLNAAPIECTDYEARRMIEGIEYQIRILAANAVGLSEPSKPSLPFTPLAPCSVPTNFKVSATTDDSIELSWIPPMEIGAAGLDGYKLEMQLKTAEGGEWKLVQKGLLSNKLTKINLEKLETCKKYCFRMSAVNKAGSSPFAEVGPVVCAFLVEEPKISLPRPYLKPVKVKVGGKLHINVPYQGKPKPVLTWTMDEKPLEEHVAVRNSPDSTVLFIRKAERWDSGRYQLELKVGEDIVKAHIDVAVIDIPSKPRQVKLVEVLGNSASLKWEEPSDSGNTDIIGYVVEKRDARSEDWFVVYDKLRHKQCQVSDLVLGNNYFFRVKAMNEVGVGDGAATKDSANIPKEKTVYKKPEYAAMDFRMKPEFTQTLNNRRIVENYNGTLSCALKCNPRPKIRWFKNKIEIIDNPKYKLTQSMGIVQLEIRRARLNDAGTYTVTATNELGEASCSAEVTIKEIKAQG
uniref:myosin-binding protein C, cardiac-type-like n=1 Tax=Styela clava TaxID=7725 RepID=UPI00193A2C3D|nr:myosin-binding protein C, cardiac-type-like [Styela clava]